MIPADLAAAEYLTPAEAAAVLGVRAHHLAHLEGLGRLTAARTPGGTRRYEAASVRAIRAQQDALASGELLTYAGVAAAFGVSRSTATRWVKTGKLIPAEVPGCRPRFRASDIRALLAGGGDDGRG